MVRVTTDLAWTEDRATQRCDPSAGPGAKTGVRAELRRSVFSNCGGLEWLGFKTAGDGVMLT